MAATTHSPQSSTSQLSVPTPTAEQQGLLDRIATQRERLRARRAARAQSRALAERESVPGASGIDASLVMRAAGIAREHPVAVAALAGVALAAGPGRLIRWAGVVLPLLMRLRR